MTLHRPTQCIIHLDHLRHNYRQLLSLAPQGVEVIAIVKANAYGHGAPLAVRTLEAMGVKRFGVATLEEGLELREKGIRAEIYVLNGLMGPAEEFQGARLYPVLHHLDELKKLKEFLDDDGRDFCAAIKFDTGMGRLGFQPSQVDDLMEIIKRMKCLRVASVMTHLARADTAEEADTERQFTLFAKLKNILVERGLPAAKFSICNSAALIDGKTAGFDWVRPGIALYGCYPHPRQQAKVNLKPVLELRTKIISVKNLQPNSPVGYGGTFVTSRETLLGILPIGYADGFPRYLSNRAQVIVCGKRVPVVGRVSMDLTAVDLTGVEGARVGEEVILIGSQGEEKISADEVAQWADTISYEILTGISSRVPRIYTGI